MILLLFFLALVAHEVFAAPAASGQPQILFDSTPNANLPTHSTQDNISLSVPSLSVISTAPSNIADSASPRLTRTNDPFNTSPPTSHQSSFSISPRPSTTIVTVIVTATKTAMVTTYPSPSWVNRTLWAAPPQMTDLSAFNITYFPSGQRNLHIVAQIPTQDLAPTAKLLQSPVLLSNTTIPSTILQLVYPAHSINPGSKPEGGADFYASPLNLAGARNVTLEYSVLFPTDFDWVKGGKLPGLFGGHTGCSGGSSARDCFSTRLMWRQQGVGELYLYAPKGKQTASLCGDAGSVCDAAYGFSIGRGTFNFSAGDWTHLRQNVILNTPGRNDGIFMLFVNERLTINRSDIFYRDVATQTKNKSVPKTSSLAITPSVSPAIHEVANTLENEGVQKPTEFLGLFFSTFFGGHGKEYATPKQQYTWFKDFAVTRHD